MHAGKIHKRIQPRGNLSDITYPRTNAITDARITCPDGNERSEERRAGKEGRVRVSPCH